MAEVDVNDILEAQVNGRFLGTDDMDNVFQCRVVTTVDGLAATMADSVAEWVQDLFDAGLMAIVSDKYSLLDLEVLNLTQNTFLGQRFPGADGLDTSDALPPQCTALVIGRTSVPNIDGRKYLPVFGEAQQVDGAWIAGAITELSDFGTRWSTTFTSAGGDEVRGSVWSRDEIPPAGRDIIGSKIIPNSRTQRRRTVGRGT